MKPTRHRLLVGIALTVLLLSGCSSAAATQVSGSVQKLFPSIVRAEATRTPFQPVPPTLTPTVTPTLTPVPVKELSVWLDPALPAAMRKKMKLPAHSKAVKQAQGSNLQIGALRGGADEFKSTWVYAIAAAFPSLQDEIRQEEIQRAWRGEAGQEFTGRLLLAADTRAAFAARWGAPAGDRVEVLPADQLVDAAWADRSARALIPFEAIEPRWKVLSVDGMSPLNRDLQVKDYPLTVWFGATGQPEALNLLREQLTVKGKQAALLPATNRDPQKMTTLVMTGVTALGRATAYKMDTLGIPYPGRDIQDWLRNADLTHISNEVSFNEDCPGGSFTSTSTMFCSRPEYIGLLEFVGADIIELSGNHNNDWGRAANSYSLELYKKRGWSTFAGGANLAEAREPLKIENHGNKIAFIGCNPAGPAGAWATADEPGAAPCGGGDYGWMFDSIRQLRDEGYLPIVTFQYHELYVYKPSDGQERDFKAAVDAGAAIVSGSQAHFPQTMEFYKGAFIHYGLGNLFFDQMDIPVAGTRQEFVDRYTIYAGRHIQTELLTALLEDYARPRPMTPDERRDFLSTVFSEAGW